MTATLVSQKYWRKPKKGKTAMSYQVAKLIARISENLPEMDADVMQGWIENPKGLQKVLRESLCPPSILFTKLHTITLPAIPSFVMDEAAQKKANIGFLGDNFRNNFFGKTEENVPEATLAISRLEKDSLDKPIMDELGDRTETSLAHFISLLEKQANGEEGVLLVNGYANVAYIKDKNRTLWAVRADWLSDRGSWLVGALSVTRPYGWSAGLQVVSRDS